MPFKNSSPFVASPTVLQTQPPTPVKPCPSPSASVCITSLLPHADCRPQVFNHLPGFITPDMPETASQRVRVHSYSVQKAHQATPSGRCCQKSATLQVLENCSPNSPVDSSNNSKLLTTTRISCRKSRSSELSPAASPERAQPRLRQNCLPRSLKSRSRLSSRAATHRASCSSRQSPGRAALVLPFQAFILGPSSLRPCAVEADCRMIVAGLRSQCNGNLWAIARRHT